MSFNSQGNLTAVRLDTRGSDYKFLGQLRFKSDNSAMKMNPKPHSFDFESFSIREVNPNHYVFVDGENNDQGFDLEWNIIEKDIGIDEKASFLVVSRTFFNDQDNRETFQTPLSVDIKKIREALLSKAPYPKDPKTGRLDIPWWGIGGRVGISLGNSKLYPPQVRRPADPNVR